MSTAARWLEDAPPGTLVPVEWVRENLDALVDETPEILTTSRASEIWSYTPEWWARECREGRIRGAWQDGESGIWRMPYASCEARIAEKRDAAANPTRRRRREPWGETPQAPRAGTEGISPRKLEVLPGGPAAVGRGPEDDEGSDGSGVAGARGADRAAGDR